MTHAITCLIKHSLHLFIIKIFLLYLFYLHTGFFYDPLHFFFLFFFIHLFWLWYLFLGLEVNFWTGSQDAFLKIIGDDGHRVIFKLISEDVVSFNEEIRLIQKQMAIGPRVSSSGSSCFLDKRLERFRHIKMHNAIKMLKIQTHS